MNVLNPLLLQFNLVFKGVFCFKVAKPYIYNSYLCKFNMPFLILVQFSKCFSHNLISRIIIYNIINYIIILLFPHASPCFTHAVVSLYVCCSLTVVLNSFTIILHSSALYNISCITQGLPNKSCSGFEPLCQPMIYIL